MTAPNPSTTPGRRATSGARRLSIKQVIERAKELGPWYAETDRHGQIRNENCECPIEAALGFGLHDIEKGFAPDLLRHCKRLIEAIEWDNQWEPKQIALRRVLERELL